MQVPLQRLRGNLLRQGGDLPAGHGQHPEGVGAHRLGHLRALQNIAAPAAIRHHVKSALGDDHQLPVHLMHGGHELSVGVEGQSRHPGIRLGQGLLPHAVPVGRQNNGRLRGVADVYLTATLKAHGAVAAQGSVFDQRFQGGAEGLIYRGKAALLLGKALHQGHAVLRQGARLIGADDRGIPQRLHRGQPADDGVALHHTLDADGQHNGHRGGQSLGDRGYRQGHRRHEQLHGRQSVEEAHRKDDGAGCDGDDTQIFSHLRQLQLEGCQAFGLALQQVCDLTHLRLHTGGGDHSGRRAVGDAAAGKYHVDPVTQGSLYRDLRLCRFLTGHGLSGEGGLFAFQADRVEQPGIGGDKVPRFQLNDVAGHQLPCFDDLLRPAPDHTGIGRGETFQGLQRTLRLALLHDPHHGVEHHDEQDQGRLKKLPGISLKAGDAERDCRRRQQNENHDVLKLLKEPGERRFFLLFTELIRPVALQPRPNFLLREAALLPAA